MLRPDQLLAIIRAKPEILPLLSAQTKAYAIGDDAYYKAIERDPKEPGAKVKMQYEKKLANLVKRIFDRQKESITPQIQADFYASKAADDYDLDWTDEEETEAVGLTTKIYGDGIDLFQQEIFKGLPDDFVNVAAKEFAKKYAYDQIKLLQKQLNETTRNAIANAISSFAEPGVTIGDVMEMLPFDKDRAMRIAVTEVTRTYASASQSAGEEMQKQFPDLTIIKTWYTNNDDRVCDICGPLHMKSVKIDDMWDGIDNPPAHVNCRCWTDYGSTLAGNVDMYQSAPPAGEIPFEGFTGEILESAKDIFTAIDVNGIRKNGVIDTLDSIDKVHHIPEELRGISKFIEINSSKINGSYVLASKDIKLSSQIDKDYIFPQFAKPVEKASETVAHEFGHLFDYNVLQKYPELRSQLIDIIRNNSGDMFSYIDKYLKRQPDLRNYYKEDDEIIARTYSQYIGDASNNPNINGAIKYKRATLREVGTMSTWTQWTPDEFKEIKNAWDDTLSQMGLLK